MRYSCSFSFQAVEETAGGSDFTFRDITVPRSHVKKEGVLCPICKTLQKRFTYHVKKCHKDTITNAVKVFEDKFSKYAAVIRQQRYKHGKNLEEFKEYERQNKKKSRQKQKEENPKKVKAQIKKENDKRRMSTPNNKPLPCALCHTMRLEFVQIDPSVKKRLVDEKANEALQSALSNTNDETECEDLQKLMKQKGTMLVVNNNEEAQTESESEYGGTWEDESDIEDDVRWEKMRPEWLLQWTLKWWKDYERIKRVIRWNIEKGTKDKDERLRWKLRKDDKYVDWLWLDLQKMWKSQDRGDKSEEDLDFLKEYTVQHYKDLLRVEYDYILNRFCTKTCKKPKIE